MFHLVAQLILCSVFCYRIGESWMERYATYYYAANRIYDFILVDLNEEVGCNYLCLYSDWSTDAKLIGDAIHRALKPSENVLPKHKTLR